MDENRLRRRWYRKKRWWAMGALWLSVVMLLGPGPAHYACSRTGWLSRDAAKPLADGYVLPVWSVMRQTPAAEAYNRYMHRWWFKALDDNSAADERRRQAAADRPKT